MASSRWLPLESNPEVINKYMKKMGMEEGWKCVDVLGFEPELLSMVPRPVAAILLVFPLSEKTETKSAEKSAADVPDVFFMKQEIGNACGTIGLIHALANNKHRINFDPTGIFHKFLANAKDLNPEERGKLPESFEEIHESSAEEGQSKVPDRDEKINLHFLCFVPVKGKLYELDGRKSGPIDHGETTDETFLENSAKIIKELMEKDPQSVQFNAIALAKDA